VEACGAWPVLVDVDQDNWNLNPATLIAAGSERTKAVLVSHLHGGLVPMSRVVAAARERGWAVVEDACQCPGAMVEGRRAGGWGEAGVWSFGGSKLLTAGRGGAMFTSRADVFQRAKVHAERGNHAFPLSEMQAAVLLPQLKKLDARNDTRLGAVGHLLDRLQVPGLRPFINHLADSRPAYYKLGFQYDAAAAGVPRDDFLAAVQAEGVALDAGFRGFVRRTARRCRRAGDLDQSARAAEGAVVLHHPVLLERAEILDRVAAAIERAACAR
jgi:dTDP-4-amino-4,6-dideoxygalactose transaminase